MKKKIKITTILLILINSFCIKGQDIFNKNVKWISGYQSEIQGENLIYNSIYPDYVNQSLLTRCTDGNKTIEWKTSHVNENENDGFYYFRWIAAHSSGTSKAERFFDLYINNEKVLTFNTLPNNQSPSWKVSATDGTILAFEQIMTDGSKDSHGINYLKVPANKIKKGEAIILKVVGHNQESNDWYMTFKYAFEEKADLLPMPFLLKNGKQVLALTILHFGNKEKLEVVIDKHNKFNYDLIEGIQTFDIPVNSVKQNTKSHILVKYGAKILKDEWVEIKPIIKREIHFLHHSHTDIGYSHLQPEVEKIHTKNIYDALEMIKKTSNYPENAQFKWNIESLWVVENFLKVATENEKTDFINAVKSGSIGLSAMYANILTGLSIGDEVFHYTDYAKKLTTNYGIKINSAMISDVPGFTWDLVSSLSKSGVKYFSSGPNFMGASNPYLGDRVGHFVKTWGDKPVWWQAPSGKEKILFWTAGKGYSSWHGFAQGEINRRGSKKIATYLNELTEQNYPYEIVQWRYNCVADNAPIDPTISDFVKNWNEKYISPVLILNTTENLFQKFEKQYGEELSIVKGDISPYWEDGAASTSQEEGTNRNNSLKLQQLTNLYALINPQKFDESKFYEAWKDILLFHEHTWGAHNSIREPHVDFVKEQWRIKKGFMKSGDSKINSLWENALNDFSANDSKNLVVINTVSWDRSGVVSLPPYVNANSVIDKDGIKYPIQILNNGQKVFYINKIAAFETKYFTLSSKKVKSKEYFSNDMFKISNELISVVSNKDGSLEVLQTNQTNHAGKFQNKGLNSFWYVPGLDAKMAKGLNSVEIKLIENGPVKSTLRMTGTMDCCNIIQSDISIFSGDKKVYIDNLIDKKEVFSKEAAYFSFPFNDKYKNVTSDATIGTIEFIKDQLPGSNLDFLCNKRWLDVSDEDSGIQMITMEAAMVCPEHFVDERLIIDQAHKKWKDVAKPTNIWHSYIINNYWHTNYKASQGGNMQFRYVLNPHEKLSPSEQEKTATEVLQPLVAFTLKDKIKLPINILKTSNEKIIIKNIVPKEDGFLIRIYNPELDTQKISLNFIFDNQKYVFKNNINNEFELSSNELIEIELVKEK